MLIHSPLHSLPSSSGHSKDNTSYKTKGNLRIADTAWCLFFPCTTVLSLCSYKYSLHKCSKHRRVRSKDAFKMVETCPQIRLSSCRRRVFCLMYKQCDLDFIDILVSSSHSSPPSDPGDQREHLSSVTLPLTARLDSRFENIYRYFGGNLFRFPEFPLKHPALPGFDLCSVSRPTNWTRRPAGRSSQSQGAPLSRRARDVSS